MLLAGKFSKAFQLDNEQPRLSAERPANERIFDVVNRPMVGCVARINIGRHQSRHALRMDSAGPAVILIVRGGHLTGKASGLPRFTPAIGSQCSVSPSAVSTATK